MQLNRAVPAGPAVPRSIAFSDHDPAVSHDRLAGLDAARGMAMLLVCLSHFGLTYLRPLGLQQADETLNLVTMAATPAFLLVSGMLLGFRFVRQEPAAFERMRLKMVDRALVLLTAARTLIFVAHVPMFGWGRAATIIFMTDVIALCLIVGTLTVPVAPPRLRCLAGGAAYGLATLLVFLWAPEPGSAWQVVKHIAVGPQPAAEAYTLAYGFPVAQWLGLYLVATGIGEWLERRAAADEAVRIATLLGAGSALVALGLLARAARPALLSVLGQPVAAWVLFATARWQKLPPGPAYAFLYGGLAFFLVAAGFWLCRAWPAAAAPITLVGRHSLVVFILQYVVYYDLVYSLRLPYTRLWPLLFAGTLLPLVAVAWAWERAGGQRWLTVGYPGLKGWASRPRGLSSHATQSGPVPTPPRPY